MEYSQKPSTKALIEVSGYPNARNLDDESDENYLLHEICMWLSDKAYFSLGKEEYELRNKIWFDDTSLIYALREALRNTELNYAAHSIAEVLAKCGSNDDLVISNLTPSTKFIFNWKNRGITFEALNSLIEKTNLPKISGESATWIKIWLETPRKAVGSSTIPFNLFPQNALYASLRENDLKPRHDELIRILFDALPEKLQLQNLYQIRIDNSMSTGPRLTELLLAGTQEIAGAINTYDARSGRWLVSYEIEGKYHSFLAKQDGTWLDVESVLDHFNEQMRLCGRVERAFQFADLEPEWGVFIVAHGERFTSLCEKLEIPIFAKGTPRYK